MFQLTLNVTRISGFESTSSDVFVEAQFRGLQRKELVRRYTGKVLGVIHWMVDPETPLQLDEVLTLTLKTSGQKVLAEFKLVLQQVAREGQVLVDDCFSDQNGLVLDTTRLLAEITYFNLLEKSDLTEQWVKGVSYDKENIPIIIAPSPPSSPPPSTLPLTKDTSMRDRTKSEPQSPSPTAEQSGEFFDNNRYRSKTTASGNLSGAERSKDRKQSTWFSSNSQTGNSDSKDKKNKKGGGPKMFQKLSKLSKKTSQNKTGTLPVSESSKRYELDEQQLEFFDDSLLKPIRQVYNEFSTSNI
ncbi:uncharacterized protein LOC142341404 [Convolutriloba macropyga]|uniref:uncharacterized protein LOC142341404 n=1 Tax=Convolutriloba macropyga TaxID=536237 RepID=UPI003F52716B